MNAEKESGEVVAVSNNPEDASKVARTIEDHRVKAKTKAQIVHVSDLYGGRLDRNSITGHVPHVNGGTSILVSDVISVYEAFALLRTWREELQLIYRLWAYGTFGSSDIRTEPHAVIRVVQLEEYIAAVVQKLCDDANQNRRALTDLRDIDEAFGKCHNEFNLPWPLSTTLLQACERARATLGHGFAVIPPKDTCLSDEDVAAAQEAEPLEVKDVPASPDIRSDDGSEQGGGDIISPDNYPCFGQFDLPNAQCRMCPVSCQCRVRTSMIAKEPANEDYRFEPET